MQLDVYNTHMELYPYKKDDYPIIEEMFTATDKMSGAEHACGYMIEDGKLFLPRGASISKIEYITNCKVRYIGESDEYEEMGRYYYPIYEPRDRLQEESIKFLCDEGAQLSLNLMTGFGKCEPVSRRIPTPSGYKLMGDIRPGDFVFGSDGYPIKVLKTFPQGEKEIYKVTFSDGRIAECGLEHLWNVFDITEQTLKTMTLEDIMKDYKIMRVNGIMYPKYYIPTLSGAIEYEYQDISVDPYTLGMWLAIGDPSSKDFMVEFGDIHAIKRACMKNNYSYKLINWQYKFLLDDKKTFVDTKDYFSDIKGFLRRCKQHGMFIPDIYIYNSPNVRYDLMSGILDSGAYVVNDDGNCSIVYQSHHKVLLEQMQKISWSLGYYAKIIVPDPNSEIYSGEISITCSKSVTLLKLVTNPTCRDVISSCIHNKQKDLNLYITDIDIDRIEEAKCLMVDSPNHLYITEDYIVTHNTFCVSYASAKLREKTIIITPNDGIKQQWINTYTKMVGVRTDRLLNINGSPIIEAIMRDDIDPADIYFVNHQTLRSYLTSNGGFALHQFFKKIKVGIKVYDESHQNFANILLVDFFSNTHRTWYLTATFDRTDGSESRCFKRAFSSVSNFGYQESKDMVEKHVIYHVVNINSHVTPKARAKLMGFPSFTAIKYGKYAIFDDPNNTVYKAILEILNKCKNMEGKILIFLPLIDAVDEVVKRLKKDTDKSVAAYHSKISREEKVSAENKDIIVSTIKSCGTGRDIKGLRCIICAEPVASKVVIEQTIGRLRPYGPNMPTYYFDLVDISIPPLNWWFKGRFKKIETLVKEVIRFEL